jgi:23S rRNA (cytidine1920-2'-O)/16S rRNA (cytidine1409-2'-O)-methyltransferase
MVRKSKSKNARTRLDALLVDRGLADTIQRARALLLAGKVRVNQQRAEKPGALIAAGAQLEISGARLPYVSRGGLKLAGALEDFGLSVAEKTCLDAGSSTGGFTDCLLQRGAKRVYAVDVTIDQLDWKLRQDSRVVPVECNARYLKPQSIAEAVDFVCVDVSFISVAKLLPALILAAKPEADFLILIKPQFELDRSDIPKGAVVLDPALHQRAIERVRNASAKAGLEPLRVLPSRVAGAGGNQEFFLHARRQMIK